MSRSEALVHICLEKRKSLYPKSVFFFLVGYFKYVKGYKLPQTHSNEIFIMINFNFD